MEWGAEEGLALLLLLHAARTCCLRGGLNDSLTQSQKCRAHAKHSTRIAVTLLPPPLPLQFSMPSGALSLLVQPISCAGIWQSDLCHVHAQHVKCEIHARTLHLPSSYIHPLPYPNWDLCQCKYFSSCAQIFVQSVTHLTHAHFRPVYSYFSWHTKCATNASSSVFD